MGSVCLEHYAKCSSAILGSSGGHKRTRTLRMSTMMGSGDKGAIRLPARHSESMAKARTDGKC